jgi:type IV secretory pathway VirD2 relaxase
MLGNTKGTAAAAVQPNTEGTAFNKRHKYDEQPQGIHTNTQDSSLVPLRM